MKTLIFVYNAKSDFWDKYLDNIHKIVSPNTYSCNLCSLTHGNFSEKKTWKDFKENSNVECLFMYKNEFLSTYPEVGDCDFPMVLKQEGQELTVILDSEKLASLKSTEALIEILNQENRSKSS